MEILKNNYLSNFNSVSKYKASNSSFGSSLSRLNIDKFEKQETRQEEVLTKETSNKKQGNVNLPPFLYHLTTKDFYKKMLETGQIKFSDSNKSEYACNGTYAVDKDNFLAEWIGRREPEIFGDSALDIGENLLQWTSKMNDEFVVIKIPTDSLDKSKLLFRPYIEACKDVILATCGLPSEGLYKGLSLSELSEFSDSPIEYIYQEIIPINVTTARTIPYNVPTVDLLSEAFEVKIA